MFWNSSILDHIQEKVFNILFIWLAVVSSLDKLTYKLRLLTLITPQKWNSGAMPRLSRIGPLSVSKINKSESGKNGQAKQIVHLIHFKQKKGIWYISSCGSTASMFRSVCNWASITDFPLPPSGAPTLVLTSHLDSVHLDTPPNTPRLHSHTLYTRILSNFLLFVQSWNRSSGNGFAIVDSPPASASLGRSLLAAPCGVTLSISPESP